MTPVETEPAFPGCKSLGVMGLESRGCDAIDNAGSEGIGGKVHATQFHAPVTNLFKYAICCSRSLASILRQWRSLEEA